MKKRTYIQPAMDTMVLPKDVMMNDPEPASGGSWASGDPADPAPKRQSPMF